MVWKYLRQAQEGSCFYHVALQKREDNQLHEEWQRISLNVAKSVKF